MKIIPLSEGTFTVDKTKQFIPFEENKDELQKRSAGSLLVEIQPFVVITSKDVLLLDTGLGFTNPDGEMQIHQNLLNEGIGPAEVTKILLTHLHKDHAGGISKNNSRSELGFPNATYYLQQKELNLAFEKGFPSFVTKDLVALKNSSKVVLLTEHAGIIDDYIQYEVTGAHSPFHEVFWIKADDQILFFGGDDAPQLQQMKHRFVAKYDFNGKKTMELRQQWWKKRRKRKMDLSFLS